MKKMFLVSLICFFILTGKVYATSDILNSALDSVTEAAKKAATDIETATTESITLPQKETQQDLDPGRHPSADRAHCGGFYVPLLPRKQKHLRQLHRKGRR